MPLLDIFWASLMFAAFGLAIWLLFVVLRDVFERDDLSAGEKVGWTALVCFLPLVGPVVYLVTRSSDVGEVQFRGASSRRREAEIYR